MKICAIHQPQFLPWLGYLDKIRRADVFVFLDDVQFKKNEFQNRNKALVFGSAQWITVPAHFAFGDTLCQTQIADADVWPEKTWRTLEYNYRKTPFFDVNAPALKTMLFDKWDSLAALNAATVQWLLRCFDIRTATCFSSGMPGLSNDPTGRLVEICRRMGADVYLSGAGGKNYLDIAAFDSAGIRLIFQDYLHPSYPQCSNGAPSEFTPYLSAIDALFNIGGGTQSRALLFPDGTTI